MSNRTIIFIGGPAAGRTLEVPILSLQRELHVKALADGVVIYITDKEGTTLYRRRPGDTELAEYEVVADGR